MKSNTITLIVLSLLIAGAAYWYFSGQSGTQAPLASSPVTDNTAQSQFEALVSELTPISFNTNIFSDQRFSALVDLTTPITPETPGRLDPFAPISGVTGQ